MRQEPFKKTKNHVYTTFMTFTNDHVSIPSMNGSVVGDFTDTLKYLK